MQQSSRYPFSNPRGSCVKRKRCRSDLASPMQKFSSNASWARYWVNTKEQPEFRKLFRCSYLLLSTVMLDFQTSDFICLIETIIARITFRPRAEAWDCLIGGAALKRGCTPGEEVGRWSGKAEPGSAAALPCGPSQWSKLQFWSSYKLLLIQTKHFPGFILSHLAAEPQKRPGSAVGQ